MRSPFVMLGKCDRICWVCGWRSPFGFLESAIAFCDVWEVRSPG
ncbi:hypothetical protein [Nostoc sp. CCY 9925]